jgi:hypothetical protein
VLVLYSCVCVCVRVYSWLTISVSSAVSPIFFLSPVFFPFIFALYVQKKRRTTVTREEEESNIGRSACAHWSVRSSRPVYRQYSQKKEKFACYSVCAILCVPQIFFHELREKKRRNQVQCEQGKNDLRKQISLKM